MKLNRRAVALPVFVLLLGGCAHREYLAPAPGAQIVPGTKYEAVGVSDGVRITADGNAWKGVPSNLQDVMTPLRVGIENGSKDPLNVRYSDFHLVTASGVRITALPPYKISGTVPGPPQPVTPAFAYSGFWMAPYYSPFYPGFAPWPGAFPYNAAFYDTAWVSWPISLPTKDMLEKAIPEGVIDPGGHVRGFLYFTELPKHTGQVTFESRLVNAKTQAKFGDIAIPLIRK